MGPVAASEVVVPSGGSKFGEMHSLIIRPSMDDLRGRDAKTYLPLDGSLEVVPEDHVDKGLQF